MTIQDYDAHEAQRMERDAWRIDEAPVLSDFISGIASESPDDMLFFNDHYLSQYMSKSKNL